MKQRIITGVVAAALFLPIVFYGGLPFVLLTYFFATVGLYELLKMKKLSIFSVHGVLALLFLWVLLFPEEYNHHFRFLLLFKNRDMHSINSFVISLHGDNQKSIYI